MKLDEGDIGCLVRDALVERLNLTQWLMHWMTASKKKQKKMLADLHKHDGSSLLGARPWTLPTTEEYLQSMAEEDARLDGNE